MSQNDFNTDEIHGFGCILGVIVFILFWLFVTSCSSHKEVCGVLVSEGDALTAVTDVQWAAHIADSSSSVTHSSVSITDSVSSTTDTEVTETITETVTETTDTTGTTTTTTQRQIQRKTNRHEEQSSSHDMRNNNDTFQSHINTIDSMLHLYEMLSRQHLRDSLAYNEQKEKGVTSLQKAADNAMHYAVAIVMIFILYLIVRFSTSKINLNLNRKNHAKEE